MTSSIISLISVSPLCLFIIIPVVLIPKSFKSSIDLADFLALEAEVNSNEFQNELRSLEQKKSATKEKDEKQKVEIELVLSPGTKDDKAIKALYAFTARCTCLHADMGILGDHGGTFRHNSIASRKKHTHILTYLIYKQLVRM